ncbi:TonB-dependent receptor [Helicobacter sp. faydin-H20]|uniref:TonB-dependent receptor n=1 Tax=Helicobacter anatolicus TaxID=2905874 RepID=UPI001E325448|nr:TonB-dependent receptor [Helicobacter anatolicus]MCE3037388.1 TonB-dependent receptor [Helicobacter anatolicus]
MYKKSWPLVFAPFILTGILIAEEKNLTPIVSTSNKIPTLITEAPGNVSFVDSKRIKIQSSKQISDILDKSAGIRVDKNTGYNGRPQVFMRGIPYGTLLMLDGVILNDLEGEFRIMQSISPFDIDRIEIVRGAFSSLYGTGGIGGVINFITKMPTKLEARASLGYGNEIQRNKAEKNLVRGYFSVGNAFLDHRLRVRASYSFSSSDGAYRVPAIASGIKQGQKAGATHLDGSEISNGDIVGEVGRTGYLTQDARIKAEYDWNDSNTTSLSINFSHIKDNQNNALSFMKDKNGSVFGYDILKSNDNSSVGYFNPFVGTGWGGFRQEYNIVGSIGHKYYFNDDDYLNIVLSSVNLVSHFSNGCNGLNCQGKGVVEDHVAEARKVYLYGGPGRSLDNYASSNYLDINYFGKINKNHSIIAGFQARLMVSRNEHNYVKDFGKENFWDFYDGVFDRNTGGAFVLASFASWQARWNQYLSTNLGLRLDYWKNFNMSTLDSTADNPLKQTFDGTNKFFPSPKFAISYNPWEFTTIKGSIGLAFRAPNTTELYAHAHNGDFQASNVNLSPEYGLQFDIGIEQRNPYGGAAKIYYYQTEMYNAIYKSGSGIQSDPFVNKNGGHNRFNGVEVEVEQKIFRDLSISANYTFTRAILLKNPQNPAYNGKMIPSIPKHMGGVALNYGGNGGFYGSLQMQGQSGAYISIDNKPIESKFGNITSRLIFDFKVGYEFKNENYLSISFFNFTNQKFWDQYRGSGASFYVEFGGKFF